MATTVMLACAALLLPGCASSPQDRPATVAGAGPGGRPDPTQPLPEPSRFGAGNIPDVLVRALADTYRRPVPAGCAQLGAEIAGLDAVLGADMDALRLVARRGNVTEQAMADAVMGLIPYRGVLRLLTGARERQRRVAEAIAAGKIRRGYLKGLGEAAGCTGPAAPLRGATIKPGPDGKHAG